MFDYDRSQLPLPLQTMFCKVTDVHKRVTRQSMQDHLVVKKFSTYQFGRNCLSYDGPKILNDLKQISVFNNARSKHNFKLAMTEAFLSVYADLCNEDDDLRNA